MEKATDISKQKIKERMTVTETARRFTLRTSGMAAHICTYVYKERRSRGREGDGGYAGNI